MTLQQIKYLLTVVEIGSITEAAKKLFISQPSLSNAIKEIEKEAGFQLFVRNRSGIALTSKGQEFLGYARSVSQQMDLLEAKFFKNESTKIRFAVSTQHFVFTTYAFVEMARQFDNEKYEFILNETQTNQIIQDVKNRSSDLGILYMSRSNKDILRKILRENGLSFHGLFTVSPHVFLSRNNPLARKTKISFNDLKPYPKLSFIQGNYESPYYSEEPFSVVPSDKIIRVSDRASIVNMMLGLNGYTIASGVYPSDWQENEIIAIPLDAQEDIQIGYVIRRRELVSDLCQIYIDILKKYKVLPSSKRVDLSD